MSALTLWQHEEMITSCLPEAIIFSYSVLTMVAPMAVSCASAKPLSLIHISAVVVCTLLGVAIERVAYKPLREAPSLAVLITAIGLSYLLQNLAPVSYTHLEEEVAAAE